MRVIRAITPHFPIEAYETEKYHGCTRFFVLVRQFERNYHAGISPLKNALCGDIHMQS